MALKVIYVELQARWNKLRDSLTKADRKTNKLSRSFKRLGGVIASAFGARALVRGFQETVRLTDELIANAEALGVSADQYERWKFALEAARVPVDQLRQGLGDLQLKLGSPALAKNFRALGLDRRELLGKRPLQQLEAILRAAARVENKTIQFRRLADVLGEESSRQLIKLIADGEEQLDLSLKTADRLGSALQDPDNVQAIKDWRLESLKLQRQWETFKQRVVIQTLPAFQGALEDIERSGVLERLSEKLAALVSNTVKELEAINNWFDMLDTRKKQLGVPEDEGFFEYAQRKLSTNLFAAPPPASLAGTPWGDSPLKPNITQTNNYTIQNQNDKRTADMIRERNAQIFREAGFSGK